MLDGSEAGFKIFSDAVFRDWIDNDKLAPGSDLHLYKKIYRHVCVCPVEELPTYIGTPYECLACARLQAE